MQQKPLLEFPCLFPIKIMGINNQDLIPEVIAIISANCTNFDMNKDIVIKHSRNNKYISITATIMANSQDQLDNIYLSLNKHELVQITL